MLLFLHAVRACALSLSAILGAVTYCIASPARGVPGVTLTAAAPTSASAMTDAAGSYRLANLSGGAYTLTPSKTGNVNGINSFDAALITQHLVGTLTLSACQQIAADASNDGGLSSFDAALIAQFTVGINNPQSIAGTWKFTPANRTYANLNSDQTGQNFSAVLVGDVSGNWASGGSSLFMAEDLAATLSNLPETASGNISLPEVTAERGAELTVSIVVDELDGRGIVAYDLEIAFDPRVLQLQSAPYETSETLSGAMTVTAQTMPGRIRVSAFGQRALDGSGPLLNLKFKVIGSGESASPLAWQRLVLNETPQTMLIDGRVTAKAPKRTITGPLIIGAGHRR